MIQTMSPALLKSQHACDRLLAPRVGMERTNGICLSPAPLLGTPNHPDLPYGNRRAAIKSPDVSPIIYPDQSL